MSIFEAVKSILRYADANSRPSILKDSNSESLNYIDCASVDEAFPDFAAYTELLNLTDLCLLFMDAFIKMRWLIGSWLIKEELMHRW